MQKVTYRPKSVSYRTFSPVGSEVLRLSFQPVHVVSGSVNLAVTQDENAEGYTVTPLDQGDLDVHLHHLQSNTIRRAGSERTGNILNSQEFSGKVAIVTGAASGIGFACADLLAARGAKVALFDISVDQGSACAGRIGPNAAFFATDVSSEESVLSSVAAAVARFGRLDVLVNCAAIQIMGTLLETSAESWDRLHSVNLKGVFLCSRSAIPHLQASGAGAIVNISSILGIVADPDLAAYGAMKGGVLALTKSMAVGYGPSGVRVNCICPGDVNTPMVAAYFDNAPDPAALRAEVNSKYALRRIAEPREIAEVVAFLASSASSFITGSVLVVDGGLTSKCY